MGKRKERRIRFWIRLSKFYKSENRESFKAANNGPLSIEFLPLIFRELINSLEHFSNLERRKALYSIRNYLNIILGRQHRSENQALFQAVELLTIIASDDGLINYINNLRR